MMPRGTTASSTSDGRDFNCSICNRSFARLEHLQRHTRTHTKEKPFLCFCGKTFTRNDLLKRHKLRSHLPEDKAPESQSLVNPDIAREGGFSQTTTESQLLSDHGQNHAEIQDSFHDFSVFLDGIGLAPAWDSLDFFDLETTQDDNESSDQHNSMLVVGGPMTHHDHVSSQAQDAQVINLEAVGQLVNAELVRQAPDPIKWKLSQSQWDELARKIEECGPVLAGFVLPSRHAMSRYFQSYVDQFHQHYPIVHIASYLAEIPPICLTLVIAAIGAQYRFESRNGQPLYEAARALLLLDRQKDSRNRGNELSSERRIVVIQGLVLLMAYGAWDWQTELFKGALDLQSILAGYMRELLEETPQTHAGESEWQRWLHEESRNRALLLAFAYLNVQSITFDLPPVILSSTIQHLALPSNADMWDAKTAHEWHILRSSAHSQVSVADAMHYLFCDEASQETQRSMRSSAIGSFIVLQALIQRITLLWQFETADHQLPPQDHARLQRALSRWKAIWQRSPDSTLDPRHAEGPVPFTSAAFLALAYARLHINIGPCHKLSSRTPEIIATALLSTPVPQCGPEIVPALLHAAHALNVPVTMGVDYASKSQIFFWNCQHSLCGLESGVFLWRWLQAAEEYTEADLNTDEKNIICWVRTSVSETLQSIGAEELGFREDVDVMSLTFPKLGVIVLRIWARIFSGNTMWAFTHEIGASLRLLADMVDR